MTDVLRVFVKGLLSVCGTVAVVAVLWTVYIQRDALASALLPDGGLVDRLRGVSGAPDSETASAPPVLAPPPPAASQPPADAVETPGATPPSSTGD